MKAKLIEKGRVIRVERMLAENWDHFFEKNDENNYTAKKSCYIMGEKAKKSVGGQYYVRHIREYEEGRILSDTGAKPFPRLRAALYVANYPVTRVPGGYTPIHFGDELVIPNFEGTGSFFYVVPRADVQKYLDALPLDEKGEKKKAEYQQRKLDEMKPENVTKGIISLFEEKVRIHGEFIKVTFYNKNKAKVVIGCPTFSTPLNWYKEERSARIVIENNSIPGFLSARKAWELAAEDHQRLVVRDQKIYALPPISFTSMVYDGTWQEMMQNYPKRVANASRIDFEVFSMSKTPAKNGRFTYTRRNKVTKF